MKKNRFIAAGTVLAAGLAAAPALASATGPQVSVRVEGLNKTLLAQTTVQLPGGSLKSLGHAYPGETAAGALQTATKGKWGGSWSSSYKEFLVTKVLGETDNYDTTKSYWEFFVDGKAASTGINDQKLKAGDSVVFAAVPASASDPELLGITAKLSGSELVAKVVVYNAKGKASALKGATVSDGTATATTGAAGTATFSAPTKSVTLVATKKGDIRGETTVPVTS